MAATDLLARGTPTRDEIVDMLSGHLCRCTGYAPIVDAIEEVGARMNLAQSLLAACERHPELEAFPGSRTASCCRGCGASQAGSTSNEASASRSCSTTARGRAPLLGVPVGGAVAVPLSWRLSTRSSATASRTAARRS